MLEIIILAILLFFSAIGNAVQGVIIRGALNQEKENIEVKNLTGRQIEEIRLKMIDIGLPSITTGDVLSLIRTIRSIQLGTYEDTDVYIPADPYDGIEENLIKKD